MCPCTEIVPVHFLTVCCCSDDSHRKWRSKLKQMKRKTRRQLEAQQRDEHLNEEADCVDSMRSFVTQCFECIVL